MDQTARFLLTANYGSGSVSVHPVATDGHVGERCDLVSLQGAKPSHAHYVWPDPAGDRVVVADLGADALSTYAFDRAFSGSGPNFFTDPAIIGPAMALLIGMTLAASLAPIMRATRLDPVIALRKD